MASFRIPEQHDGLRLLESSFPCFFTANYRYCVLMVVQVDCEGVFTVAKYFMLNAKQLKIITSIFYCRKT